MKDSNKPAKAVNQSRSWMLTISAKHFDRNFIANALSKHRYVGQMERGAEKGYLHWQIFIDNPSNGTPIKFTTLRNAFPTERGGSVRIEPYDKQRGTKQACYNYVTKADDTAIPGTRLMRGDWSAFEHGKTKKQTDNREEYLAGLAFRATIGQEPVSKICRDMSLEDARKYRNELEKRQLEYLTEINSNATRNVKVNYLTGRSRIGKTTALRELLGTDVYRISQYRREPWDQYIGQKKVIIDEFRGQIDFSEMLNILDGHPMILGARYNNKMLLADEIWVVSNRDIKEQYSKERNEHPEDWEAFYARFHNIYRMEKRGEPFELIATPAADQLTKFVHNGADL